MATAWPNVNSSATHATSSSASWWTSTTIDLLNESGAPLAPETSFIRLEVPKIQLSSPRSLRIYRPQARGSKKTPDRGRFHPDEARLFKACSRIPGMCLSKWRSALSETPRRPDLRPPFQGSPVLCFSLNFSLPKPMLSLKVSKKRRVPSLSRSFLPPTRPKTASATSASRASPRRSPLQSCPVATLSTKSASPSGSKQIASALVVGTSCPRQRYPRLRSLSKRDSDSSLTLGRCSIKTSSSATEGACLAKCSASSSINEAVLLRSE